MTPPPAIYGQLSDEAETAYRNWLEAIMRRADHALLCRPCATSIEPQCPIGYVLSKVERAFWARWYVLRTGGPDA